jgi:trehalose-phosphatase
VRAALERLAASNCALVFDFDGTLAPIRARPEQGRLDPRLRAGLIALCARYPCAVLSGRARHDLAGRVAGIGFRALIGNHGLQDGARRPDARVRGWARALRQTLRAEQGVLVEDKLHSVSVHYREASSAARARRATLAAIAGLGPTRVIDGKRVLNVLPPGRGDKGAALRSLLSSWKVERALYVGDDVTDEPGFAVPGVLGIRIGRTLRGSRAAHLSSRARLASLIDLLVRLRSPHSMPAKARSPRASPVATHVDVLDFLRQLWAVDHALQRRSKRMLRERGITGPQRLALRLLLLQPGMSAGDLAAAMHVHPSTLTGVLERLERGKLLLRKARPGDQRSVELRATAKGAEIVRETRGTVEDAVRRSLARHSKRELAIARTVLSELESELLGR